jgi:hypothetical protein
VSTMYLRGTNKHRRQRLPLPPDNDCLAVLRGNNRPLMADLTTFRAETRA